MAEIPQDNAQEPGAEDSQSEGEKSDAALLSEAKERFKLAQEAEREIREAALEDMKFAAGDQWPAEIRQARQLRRRPCLTINRLPQSIRQVTNDQRQNRPSIKVHPVDDKGDPETAKIYSGLIRHIEYNSNADTAYDTAFDGAVRGGFGYWRVLTDYVSPLSFKQELLIKRIRNPMSVTFDPHSKEPDGSDANFAFVSELVSKAEYKKQYPESKLAQASEWESFGDTEPDWFGDKSIRVVEHFYKEWEPATLLLLGTGETLVQKDLIGALPSGVSIVAKRKTLIPSVKWCKFNGSEILEKADWAGSFIPIIPVYGEELDIDGKRILKGITRDAKDPQQMYNFWKSAETEAIALAPKAPWLVEEGQVEKYETDWETANTENHAFLKYKAVSLNGSPIPPPSRLAFEPAVQAITQAAMHAADDLKATTGIYDASLGAKSNETSGVAIQRRNNQAQTSNFHFVDNLTRSIRHTGRILIELIPVIYDTADAARIIGEDGEPEIIRINEEFMRAGKRVRYDLSAGKYDCTVDVGPSYASKRQEAAASMVEVAKAVPQVMQAAPDLMVKNMDWPGAQEIAERLKKTLPPGLADDPNANAQDVPPQVQAQMQQMGAMLEQAQRDRADLLQEREQRLIEIESKERIELKKLEVQLEIERAKLDAKDALALLNAEIAQINNRLSFLRMDEPIDQDAGAEAPQEPAPEQHPMDGGMPAGPMPGAMAHPGGDMQPDHPMEMNDVDPSGF